ncbi:MAG: hypothetical protein JWR22_1302 [Herminiimonas sp.]|nr:hypothetical protein [Herminiimonas sp.]
MDHQIIPVDEITRRARDAAEGRLPVTACPFPEDTDAAIRWQVAFHAKEVDLLGESA